MTEATAFALLAGQARMFARGEASAIAKAPLAGPVKIGFLGLEGDEQADRRVHGGPDKALHHYPHDHYARWREGRDGEPLLAAPGAFGENVATLGLTEEQVCIGDRFRLGSALVEISQGRQPCWKQGERLHWAALPGADGQGTAQRLVLPRDRGRRGRGPATRSRWSIARCRRGRCGACSACWWRASTARIRLR